MNSSLPRRADAARVRSRTVAFLVAIAALAVAPPARALTDVCYEGGSLLPNFKLNGNAVLNGTDLVVTQSVMGQISSLAYYPKFSASTDFHIELQVEISMSVNGGADGMAFVMHNDPSGPSAVGQAGEGIGYEGIQNSVIVEFDTFQNDWDPNSNHIALTRGGDPDHLDANNAGLPVVTDPDGIDLKSGMPVFLWIDYASATKTLSVSVASTSTKPADAAMTAQVDLSTEIGPSFYAAFTGSTGGAWSQHEVVQLFASDHAVNPRDGCCASDADCATSPAGPICDPAKHLCGLCVESDTSHCPPAMPACDLSSSSNQCTVACNGNNGSGASHACVSVAFPACTTPGSCATCNGDFQSTGSIDCGVGAPFCSPTGYCGLCTTNGDCRTTNAVHLSLYCNGAKGACVGSCASDADCGPGNVCDAKDGKCGYANGDGPCTAATAAAVCRSATCGAMSNECVPAGGEGCAADADCSAGNYCDGSTLMCSPTLANGQTIPSDGLHDGACTQATGEAVCAAGVCDRDGRCGLANGHTVCATGAQCRSSLCDVATGACAACDGDMGSSSSHRCQSKLTPYCSADGLCTAMKAASSQTVAASSGGCIAAGGASSSMTDLAGLGTAVAFVAASIRQSRKPRTGRASRD